MSGILIVATNRKARYEYHISDRFEAGLALRGTEVKSLREGKVTLQEAFCTVRDGQVTLVNCHIPPYKHGTRANHDPDRPRKLLLNRREIAKLAKAVDQKGSTIVPLKVYFKNGLAKLEIGVAVGKKQYDKRSTIADRQSKRDLGRILKETRNR